MADTKFAELKTAIRQAELQREIADLPSSPKALRTLITILSEQGSANMKTDTGFGYLRAITSVTKTLEDVPPRLWGNATQEIEYILSFADRDSFLAPDELEVLKSTAQALTREITRQSRLAVRTAGMLARGVKRLGEGILERGAGSQNIVVRMGSKLALASIERRRTTKEVGKEFARARAGALGAISSYRTPFAPLGGSPLGNTNGDSFSRVPTGTASGEATQLRLPIEFEQLSELKKINRTLVRQIGVAENIDEENDKQRAIEQSRLGFGEMERGIETPRMTLASISSAPASTTKTPSGSIFSDLLKVFSEGIGGVLKNIMPFGEALAGVIPAALGAAPALLGITAAAYGVKKVMDMYSAYKGYTEGQSQLVKDQAVGAGIDAKNIERSRKLAIERAKALGENPNAPGGAFLSPTFYLSKTNKMGIFKPGSAELLPGKELPSKETAPAPLTPSRVFGAEMLPAPPMTPSQIGGGDMQYNLRQSLASQGILDPKAQANIFAQIQGESQFELKDESLNYSPQRLFELFGVGNKFGNKVRLKTIKDAEKIVAQGPVAIGNLLYGGRMGNASSEGFLYRGRGYIQLTGKDNYKRVGDMIGVDLVTQPDLVNDPIIGAQVVAAYYKMRAGKTGDLTDISAVNRMTGFATGSKEAARRMQSSADFLSSFNVEPSVNRNASPVSTLTGALTSQGQNVMVMNAPTMAPIVNVQGGGSTVVPMPIRTEPLENTLLALTRLNYV